MDFGLIKRKVSLSSRKVRAKACTDSIPKSSKAEPEPYSAYTSPLPQPQWSEIPLPFRPRDWVDGSDRERTLLHPQRNQHVDDYSTISDQSRASPRSISQPNTPSHLQTRFDEYQPTPMPSLGIPRSPTCPPTGRRRMHSDSGIQDDAFRNESDFRLFVEATAGLEPEQPPKTRPDPLHYPSDTSPHHYGPSQPYDIVSPVAETPTTLCALQGIAQMPKSVSPPLQQREASAIDPIAFDLSLHSAVPPSSGFRPPTGSSSTFAGARDSPLSSDEDEELPDYAASQAQAQAAQRVEAARRAQELQRRWQEGAKRRGF
ncbi:hypothetical protein D0859_09259 [Hortaea werneckii]|uniref:Uncharacterized protein n=1 Tax=Hortaea werneckii TaxID=91943 RepID=A0A3M7IMI0_HORWE|nr:hypothetical protein D0859_09259 [Hortaea werneckii]